MSDRKFKFRLSAEYETEKNDISSLIIEHWVDHQWREYDPRKFAAGFLIFLYAVFDCQHMHFAINAAQRGIALSASTGTLEAQTNDIWELQKLHIHFDAQLRSGTPGAEDQHYIVDRMSHCPVSVNLKPISDLKVTLNFT